MPNRIIKESICTSEEIDSLDAMCETFFYRLMVSVDDFGLLDARPAIVKSKCYPLKSIDSKSIQAMLGVLNDAGLISLYQVEGKPYLQITSWAKHQQIRAQRAKFPTPDMGSAITCNQLIANVPVIQSNPIQSESNPNPIPSPSALVSQDQNHSQSALPPVADVVPSPFPKDNLPKTLIGEIREGNSETELQAACRETWVSYAGAYFDRYGTEPVRNAKVNGQVKQFVQRIGARESPDVAAYYLTHHDSFYVRKLHDFGLLLADAEKIRTEWATGRKITGTRAKQTEQTGTMTDIVAEIQRERGQG